MVCSLGMGNGQPGLRADHGARDSAPHPCSGDFNQDGKQDLAAVTNGSANPR